MIQPHEKVCTGIDHLNGIIQKHIQRGNLLTDETKIAKLKEALEIPSLNQLWSTISMHPNPTHAKIVATSKGYDNGAAESKFSY